MFGHVESPERNRRQPIFNIAERIGRTYVMSLREVVAKLIETDGDALLEEEEPEC